MDIVKKYWKLEHRPNLVMAMDQQAVSARTGYIYFYSLTNPFKKSAIDYESLQLNPSVSIRLSCRFRETLVQWIREVLRILASVRRGGPDILGGYLFLEFNSVRMNNDASGWYSATIDVELHQYNAPLHSAGFNDDLNTALDKGDESVFTRVPEPITYNGEKF